MDEDSGVKRMLDGEELSKGFLLQLTEKKKSLLIRYKKVEKQN
jgi:hypothetical protein